MTARARMHHRRRNRDRRARLRDLRKLHNILLGAMHLQMRRTFAGVFEMVGL